MDEELRRNILRNSNYDGWGECARCGAPISPEDKGICPCRNYDNPWG